MPDTQKVSKQQQKSYNANLLQFLGGTFFTIAANRYILWILIK